MVRAALFFALLAFAFLKTVSAQNGQQHKGEEIVVRTHILGTTTSFDLTAFLAGDTLFLPMQAFFSKLEIEAAFEPQKQSISGFFLRKDRRYSIQAEPPLAELGSTAHPLDRTNIFPFENDLYLNVTQLGALFGLYCSFDELSLTLFLTTSHRLPVTVRAERQRAREILAEPRNAFVADEYFLREKRWFGGAMMDWNFGYSNRTPGFKDEIISYGVGLGGELLGGDAQAFLNGNSLKPIDWNLVPWRWRYYTDASPLFRQMQAGHLATNLGRYFAVRGVQLSNAPIQQRTEFDEITIEDITKPSAEVELYQNNKLIAFTKADSDGRYSFTVPTSYGTSLFKIISYDEDGSVAVNEKSVTIPYQYLPRGVFEYNLTGGQLLYADNRPFGLAQATLGLSHRFTVAAGVQYVDRTGVGGLQPFATVQARIRDDFLLSTEYIHNLHGRFSLSAGTPHSVNAFGAYTRIARNPFLNPSEFIDEKRLVLTVPFGGSFATTTFQVSAAEYSQHTRANGFASFFLTSSLRSTQFILNSRIGWSRSEETLRMNVVEHALTVIQWITRSIILKPVIEFDQQIKRFSNLRASVDIQLFGDTWLSASYYRNMITKRDGAQLQLRIITPWAQFQSRADVFGTITSLNQTARGSLGYDAGYGDLVFDHRNWVGRSAVSFIPFFDANGNGRFESSEESVSSRIPIHITGGRVYDQASDRTRIVDLQPYHTYLLEIDPHNLSDPAYRPQYRSLVFVTDPNRFKAIKLPIYIGGETSGSISRVTDQGIQGQSGMTVTLKRKDGRFIDQTISFHDGTFTFFGLPPGTYTAELSAEQLNALRLNPEPAIHNFTVRSTPSGDIVTGLDFLLTPRKIPVEIAAADTIPPTIIPQPTRDTTTVRPKEPSKEPVARPLQPVRIGTLANLPIDLGKRTLDQSTIEYLDRVAETWKNNPNLLIRIEGHSDNFGSFQENQERSESRANRALQYLISKGVIRSKIQVQAFGSRRPIAVNTTPEGRAKNNRVDITVLQP